MLDAVGVDSIEDLFADIPPQVRAASFDLPAPAHEQEVRAELTRLPDATDPASASWAPAPTGTWSRRW